MQSAENIRRAHRLEWEHMMPAENFGKQLVCWREKICQKKEKNYNGRKYCTKISAEFRQMESELYNLWPSEWEKEWTSKVASIEGYVNPYIETSS